MSRRKAKSAGRDKVQNDSNAKIGWTTQHHLVGNTLTRSFLRPAGNSYEAKESQLEAIAFQSEDTSIRRPALWRSLIHGESPQDPAHAFDCVAGDWQGSTGDPVQPVPSDQAISAVRERYQSIVYETVLNDWLPAMIMTAAVEECQAHYLKQAAMERTVSGDTESSSRGRTNISSHAAPARYYHQNPNSYFTISSNSSGGSGSKNEDAYIMPVQFTPSQLVSRIKQGCNMVFAEYDRLYSSSDDLGSALERRASSRIARTIPDEPTDPTLYWKVLPGGRVATLLKEQLLDAPVKEPAVEEAVSEEAGMAVKEEAVADMDVVVEPDAKLESAESNGAALPQSASTSAGGDPAKPTSSDSASVAATAEGNSTKLVAPAETSTVALASAESSAPSVEGATDVTLKSTSDQVVPTADVAGTLSSDLPANPVVAVPTETKQGEDQAGPSIEKPSEKAVTSSKLPEIDCGEKTGAVAAEADLPSKAPGASDEVKAATAEPPSTAAGTSSLATAEVNDRGDVAGDDKDVSTSTPVVLSPEPEASNGDNGTPAGDIKDEPAPSVAESPAFSDPMDDVDEGADEDDDYAPQPEELDGDEEDASGEYTMENPSDLAIDRPTSRGRRKSGKKRSRRKDGGEVAVPDEPVAMEIDSEPIVEEDEEEDVDVVNGANPFLVATPQAIIEWCGRKTAKLLTSADLQQTFPALLHVKPTKSKKKKSAMLFDPSELGEQLDKLLNETDRRIWEKTLERASVLEGPSARLAFQLVNEIDASEIQDWETASFGRSLFTVRILNDDVKNELTRQAREEVALAEKKMRAQRTWENWRYKAIQTGFTVWPNWIKVVEAWLAESNKNKTDPEVDTVTLKDSMAEAEADLVLAQTIAEQESAATTGGRRKTRRAIDGGGVFYGNQATMTQKQLMDTILRLASQKSYHTAMGLIAAVPDESSDPMRRIRSSLGKLVWKRRQLAQLQVDLGWTDAKAGERLLLQPLVRFAILATSSDDAGDAVVKSDSQAADKRILLDYIKSLHQTELQLRKMVMKHLSEIPVHIVATVADERTGSMEAMDEVDFDDTSQIEWSSSGHELIGQLIFRPESIDEQACHWYRIEDYAPAVETVVDEADPAGPIEKPNIGSAKDPQTVRRRMRFRASPTSAPGHGGDSISARYPIILTEAQARAGMKAAGMEEGDGSSAAASTANPFAGSKGSKVTLLPPESSGKSPINGSVVGHDSEATSDGIVHHRILILTDGSASKQEAIWVRIESDSGVTHCTLVDDSTVYTLQQFDYHTDSPAFQQCRAMITYLRRHPKASPFLEPVDPVSLNIPDYFQVVKNPMDISTLSEKLERGEYSSISSGETIGQSPISRMLNGPFRRDLELIFDNAMLFNPPNDWIHIAASTVKKGAIKKIEQACLAADDSFEGASRKKSVYVDYDSDVDMYVYESDNDEDYDGERRRKRKRQNSKTPSKEDPSSRAVERPLRLQKFLSSTLGLRGPFANLPLQSDASVFSLPTGWNCRRRGTADVAMPDQTIADDQGEADLDELVSLYRDLEQTEVSARRSTRAAPSEATTKKKNSEQTEDVEYYSDRLGITTELPANRTEVESVCEKLHEELFAKMYYDSIQSVEVDEDESGLFADGSFPPYLGRAVPAIGPDSTWEIREAYTGPALRWVLRGLIQSGHLGEVETVDSTDAGVIVANNVYYIDEKETPFQVVDVRQLTRRKRANDAGEGSSDDDVEMSEYEKMRAERVARNAERLKSLGLG